MAEQMPGQMPATVGTARPTRREIERALSGISPRRQAVNDAIVGVVDGATEWLRRHWLAVVNGALLLFIATALIVPLGYALGLTGPSSAVFNVYRFACAQTPSHSFYIAGYQTCLCARCLAIYSSLLVGGLLVAIMRGQRTLPSIPWRFWLLAMVPMALDGGTQLFGWRESNVGLRLLTGCIFGLATAWFLLPQIEQAARDE